MAITLVDYDDGFNGRAGSYAAATNAAMQAGDVRLVCICISANTITTPTGWNLISPSPLVVSSTRRIYWFWRTHSGSDPSYTFTFSASSHHSAMPFALRDADTTNPVDVAPAAGSGASGTTVTAPALTTVTAGAFLVSSFHKFVLTATRTLTTPTGMTLLGTGSANGSVGQSYLYAAEERATTGTTGTRVSTSNDSGNAWGASSIAIKPASAPAAVAQGRHFLATA